MKPEYIMPFRRFVPLSRTGRIGAKGWQECTEACAGMPLLFASGSFLSALWPESQLRLFPGHLSTVSAEP